MYKSILYVEDGSTDVDELKSELGEDVYIVVYRTGSQPPTLIQPEKPLQSLLDSKYFNLQNRIGKTTAILKSSLDFKMSKKLRAMLSDALTELNKW